MSSDTTTSKRLLDLVPHGPRVLSPRDLVQHLNSTEAWWIRQRPRMVKAGLLVKAGRRFIGDLAKIQAAIADPAFWAEESESRADASNR